MKQYKLGDICEIKSGGTPSRSNKKFFGGSIPWAKISDITEAGTYISETEERITEEGLEDISKRIFPQNTLLFSMYGSLGKTAITAIPMSTNQAILGIQPDKEILALKYLKYWCDYKQDRFIYSANGVALKNLSATKVKNFKISLPSLEVQQQIVEILDEAVNLREKREKSLNEISKMVKSIFIHTFGDPQTNNKRYPKGTIRDLVEEVKYGTSSKSSDSGNYAYLRMNNIDYDGYMDYSDLKYINLEDKEIPKYTVKMGDLIFNRTNSKELVGKTGIFEEEEPMALAGYNIRVRTNKKANPYYIWGYLNSIHGKQTLENMCKSIVGMANINAQELQDIEILIPPIEDQNLFEKKLHEIKTLKEQAFNSKKYMDNLFNSLLQKTFNGELV
ncbi:restriction endonuclease subunit S [Candidatus Micrarchaeota archaeon]|nr:restriction endonuclease subunit S [Candidatus Micrarchaeota archaeon]